MAKRVGMYSSEKRRKELKRQKKQEEKRLKRLKGSQNPDEISEETEAAGPETGSSEETSQETD